MSDQPQKPDLERLLEYIRETRGFDFGGYKRATLLRRVAKRMVQVGVKDYAAYLDHLQGHPEEFAVLFNTILINVTSYFRDAPAWEYLQGEILPKIIASKERYEPIRVWSAGVASGEEAYSVAMLLSETLGASEYRERAKIYATDVDQEALAQARQGRAEEKDLEEVPATFREKYFEREGSHYVLRGDLRRSIIFGRHDLMQDAPISRIDLLVSRNTLMYFEADAQAKILARLHYALTDKGYLFLGKAEMLLSRTALFTPVDLKQRVFTKVPQESLKDRLVVLAQAGSVEPSTVVPRQSRVRELVSDALPIAHFVVDTGGIIISVNERARAAFGLVTADVGRPLQDLEISYRPLDLRSMIDEAYRNRRAVKVQDVERRRPNAEPQFFDVEVVPLVDRGGALHGASISFTDVSGYNRVHRELERSKHALETASEELQSTNEELETTNEELQSTNEELETTNEELQSTNEELLTTIDEVQASNEQLAKRTAELRQIELYHRSILQSMSDATLVLDRQFKVTTWNSAAERLWNLPAAQALGRDFFSLPLGPVVDLTRAAIRTSDGKLRVERPLDVEVPLLSSGRKAQLRLVPLGDGGEDPVGVVGIVSNVSS